MKIEVIGKLAILPILLGSAIGLSQVALAQSWGIATEAPPNETEPNAPASPNNASPNNASPNNANKPTRETAPLVTDITDYMEYGEVIERTKSMINDPQARRLAAAHDLQIMDVTWEDTGRYDNSSVGPNISDMTIQVEQRDPRSGEAQLHLMPVIRYPNFSDLTADVPTQRLSILTGNEKGETVEPVLLAEVLENLRDYLSEPDAWAGRRQSLLAERDSHVLVSAQAAFLPIPAGGEATFNPVLFNYQSYPGDPAVLTLLATREGTSITVIDNQRDGFDAGRTWGQRLFFNKTGERASLTGKRISDFRSEQADGSSTTLPPVEATEEEGLNMVMLIQVPLKQKRPSPGISYSGTSDMVMMEAMPAPTSLQRSQSNVEAAVIGHGPVEGPFTEIDNLDIERDPNFPIRVTIQFYKATSNGVVSAENLAEIDQQIKRIYDDADYVGSLVTDGRTRRPTEYDGEHTEPEDWWEAFWNHSQNRLNLPREDALELLRRLRGQE
ncbi:MAG: hypothetical protein HC800_14805 [Phormidesmis sp. RL_2_1]|nr:hypothetical protein [Phormidesmis sp. RL_2_1]